MLKKKPFTAHSPELPTAVGRYAQEIKQAHDEWMNQYCPNVQKDEVTVQYLEKRIRIILGTSVFCFIEPNGDILKAASYRAPAKGARGNVFTEHRPNRAALLYRIKTT